MLARLRYAAAFAALLLIPFAHADVSSVKVPVAKDLSADGTLAARKGIPIMLVFSAYHCTYCEILEREIVKPMIKSGEYENKVIIRKVRLDEGESLRDFDGELISAESLANRMGAYVTPTTAFVDSHGHPLAKRLIGINTVEFFGGRVDRAIERSTEMIQAQHQHPANQLSSRAAH
jgi:thioredoxin-related protein